MGTSKQSNRQRGPGTVSLAALARHWRVVPTTAKKICAERGIQDTETRSRARYRWQDVWRAEGAANVDPALWEAYRAPLLKPKDLGDMFPELSERTIRRDLESSRWPVIRLGKRTRLVRAVDVAEELEIRAGKRPVRRPRAPKPEIAAIP